MADVDKYIGSFHIQKLTHKILEIRERALFSIISKLDSGFIFDNDLARTRELLSNLFNWFLFEPCTNEEHVLSLIQRILQSSPGKVLIAHCGKSAIELEIEKIRSYINPKFQEKLDKVLSFLKSASSTPNFVVPPLSHDIPLSYRSNCEEVWMQQNSSPIVGSTASTIRGLVEKGSSLEQQIGFQQSLKDGKLASEEATYRLEDKFTLDRTATCRSVPTYSLKWQPLIETDRNVLQSVESSLKNPQDSSMLYHSCEFFINVLLHDFPAEVFIQRPGIITIFYELIFTCRSTRLTNIILHCLYDLTKALQIRLNHCNDPCMQNLKTEMLPNLVSFCATPASNRNSENEERSSSDHFELPEETNVLRNNQFTMSDYYFRTMNIILKCISLKQESLSGHKPKLNQTGLNVSLILLDELTNLLYHTLGESIWKEKQNSEILAIFREINNTLSLYGDTLEYFRLESLSLESNLKCRVIYLYLLCTCAKWLKNLVPLSKTNLILPKNFKLSLTNSLLDISLGRLYPKVHKCLLQFVESFSSTTDTNCLKKYEDVMRVCDGLTATVEFLRNSENHSTMERFKLAHTVLPSVEFHRNIDFLEAFVNLCSEKFYEYRDNYDLTRLANETTLELLAHRLPEIQKEMYALCHKKVVANIGTQINLSHVGTAGSEILFLLNIRILTQITLFGLNNEYVKHYAEEMLLYILKCKVVVAEPIWDKCVEALIPTLPIIICYGDNSSALGRTIINLVDPDTAKALDLPDIVMLKGNVELLFAKDPLLRDEAFSRICWLIAKQENSREILPKFNTIYDKALSNACNIRKILDVNKIRKSDHFYQPSSLDQVLDLLKSEKVEPVIRRSALNQVSVMMDDHLLHDVFLDASGLNLMIDLMKRALQENDFREYPDSIIPIVSILKTLALYHSSIREELGLNLDVLYYTLRGLFLFFTEDRIRQDACMLLFLLVFKDYVSGTPSRGDFSIPALVSEKLLVPFIANIHMSTSGHVSEDLLSGIIQDKWSLTSLQIQWNTDLHGGFNNLIKLDESDFLQSYSPNIETNDILALKANDLKQIKSSSLRYCIRKYLFTIQSATSHEVVEDCITKLTLYLHFYNISSQLSDNENNHFLSHPWEKTFTRYLEVLPSSEEDIHLLTIVIKFLIILVPFYKDSENCWISKFLKNPRHLLLDILAAENISEEDTKILSQDLLKLITLCAIREHHYLDFSIPKIRDDDSPNSDWEHIIMTISDNLRFNNTQHFYNLAYLDALLSCLVNLTARLGWSRSKAGHPPREPIPQLISSLCELITAFHCGKGASATVSVMGLSVSRNVLLILNHLLAELHHFKVKKWEQCFFENDEIRATRSFLAMWASRDVILRAAALQLFSNLTTSPKAADEIVNDLRHDNGNIWELAMTIITDHTEAGIVRENAALLLANLSSHMFSLSSSTPSLILSVSSANIKKQDTKCEVLSLLEEYDFYNHLDIILTSLFTLDYMIKGPKSLNSLGERGSEKSYSSGSEPREFQINVSTPGFVKAICILLYNIVELAPKEICARLQERGLVKLIFRTLCNPSMTIDNKRELTLYCNILEMNTSVCIILRKICSLNSMCIGTVLYTKDCLNVLFSLLSSKMYHTHLSQLLYLRNNLWSGIFNLIAMLLEEFNEENASPRNIESLSIVAETIEETGTDIFLDALCESLGCIGTSDLQNSALTILVSLLRLECGVALNKSEHDVSKKYSIENILDTVRTPKTIIMSCFKENIENLEPQKKPLNLNKNVLKNYKYKNNILEEAYFGSMTKQIRPENVEDIEVSIIDSTEDALMVGGELCKLLLFLFEIINIKLPEGPTNQITQKKSLVIAALTGILCISHEAKKFALQKGLMEIIVKDLRDYHIRLSLESVENLRRVQDKKRICPILQDIGDLVGLLTNFMLNSENVKSLAASLNLADVMHKLWIWFCFQNTYIADVLKMLSVYTLDCPEACRSLPLTSSVAGSGPRKTPSNVSLLHSIISVIIKEMDQVSRSHDLLVLELAFDILHHCCDLLECRVVLSKSNLFHAISRLHPAVTKRQYPWDSVEHLWLEFLQTYTRYPEGQTAVAKDSDVLDLIMALTAGNKEVNRQEALMVLRNVTFYQPNRPRLLSSGDFLNILQIKLTSGSYEEKKTVVAMMWSLAANNQKAKLIFKSAKLDAKLENTIKCAEFLGDSTKSMERVDLEMMYLVLNVIRGKDNVRWSK